MEVVVDTRPLWIVLLSRSTRILRLLLGVTAYFVISRMDTPEGLTPQGQQTLAVFALCVTFWALNVLPLMITSLLAIALLPLTGVLESEEAYALFGNSALFFILGAFILAACLMKSGLSTRMSLLVLRRFGHSPRALLAAVFFLNACLSLWMSEHAVAAMNFPIVAEIAAALALRRGRSNYGKALFVAMAWGSTIGGVGTLLGGGRAPLALGVLEQVTGEPSFTFLSWSLHALPVVLVLLAVGYWLLQRWFPIDIDDVAAAEDVLAERVFELGRARFEEKAVGAIMLLTVAAWVCLGHRLGLANVAIIAVVALFALRLVAWRDVEESVNWGIVLMYGGAICLGKALDVSGAAGWIAERTVGVWASSPAGVCASLSLSSWLLTEAMSNSAVVALMMPIGLGLAREVGMSLAAIAPAVAVPAGLAFAFPIGTPANAIAYSSGYLRLRDLIVPGLLMGALGWCAFNLAVRFYWPLLGVYAG
ncbi:MAG: DASS family sodium-coupled anion symporter [Deltaproteobacteria bacterium]|nr:MAG: DASS family sodium-coupled anion symporter [Deltaproteobacteria bacterium]